MKNSIKILFSILFISALSLFLYSCLKEDAQKQKNTEVKAKFTPELLKSTLIAKGYTLSASGRSVGEGCYAPPQDPKQDCFNINVSYVTAVPAYGGNPACDSVHISYELRACLNPDGTISTSISAFNALPLNGCTALTDYWLSLNDNNLEIALNRFFYRASLDAEILILTDLAQSFQSFQSFFCPNYSIQSTYSEDLCFRYCVKFIKKPFKFTVKKVLCGRKCCLRKRSFCLNPDGTVEYTVPEFTEIGDDCGKNPIISECDGKLIGECSRTCGPK